MAWTDADQVRERIRQATAANNWLDADIEARITRAEDWLKAYFTPRYGATEVALWDTPATCPTLIDDLAADLGAYYVYLDAYGQTPSRPGTAAAALYERVQQTLKDLAEHRIELVLSDGTMIYQTDTGRSQIESTTREREPLYTMGEQVQDTNLPGTLDDL